MQPLLFSGRANPGLAAAVAAALGIEPGRRTIEDFPDGEIHVRLEDDPGGRDVYLLQPTGPPVDRHLLELLLLADACRRGDAARLTALVPYFGYARQDRRAEAGEAVGGRVAAGLIEGACDRLVAVDLHNPAIEGFFSRPVLHLSAVPLLAEALRSHLPPEPVLVAPDLGAVKLAERYARHLGLPVAYLHKVRCSGEEVEVRRVAGEVRGRSPVVVDDMISTGGTLAAAIGALLEQGCREEVVVAASHGLLVGEGPERLAALPVRRILTTDSVLPAATGSLPLVRLSLDDLLADAVRRLGRGGEEGRSP